MLCDLIAVYSITRKLAIKSHTFSIKMFDTIQKKITVFKITPEVIKVFASTKR